MNRYPDREFTALREGFADYLGLRPDARADLGGERIERGAPARPAGVRRTGAHRVRLRPDVLDVSAAHPRHRRERGSPGTRVADFTVDAESAASQVAEAAPDVVFLCAPNNPTGTPMTLDVIEAVYDATERDRRRR